MFANGYPKALHSLAALNIAWLVVLPIAPSLVRILTARGTAVVAMVAYSVMPLAYALSYCMKLDPFYTSLYVVASALGGASAGIYWTGHAAYFGATQSYIRSNHARETDQSLYEITTDLSTTFGTIFLAAEILTKTSLFLIGSSISPTIVFGTISLTMFGTGAIMQTCALPLHYVDPGRTVLEGFLELIYVSSDARFLPLTSVSVVFGLSGSLMNVIVVPHVAAAWNTPGSLDWVFAAKVFSLIVGVAFAQVIRVSAGTLGKEIFTYLSLGTVVLTTLLLGYPPVLGKFACCEGWVYLFGILFVFEGVFRSVFESSYKAIYVDYFTTYPTAALTGNMMGAAVGFSLLPFINIYGKNLGIIDDAADAIQNFWRRTMFYFAIASIVLFAFAHSVNKCHNVAKTKHLG